LCCQKPEAILRSSKKFYPCKKHILTFGIMPKSLQAKKYSTRELFCEVEVTVG
jgi:hypothetical protein